MTDGEGDGSVDGTCDGYDVGYSVGKSDGVVEGNFVGDVDGIIDGHFIGFFVGDMVGKFEGLTVGLIVGDSVGNTDGDKVGCFDVGAKVVGVFDGDCVGFGLNCAGILAGHEPLHMKDLDGAVFIEPNSIQLVPPRQSNEQSPEPQRIFMSDLHASAPAHLIVTSVASIAFMVVPSEHAVLELHNMLHASPGRQLFGEFVCMAVQFRYDQQ